MFNRLLIPYLIPRLEFALWRSGLSLIHRLVHPRVILKVTLTVLLTFSLLFLISCSPIREGRGMGEAIAAPFCRLSHDHQICILDITRSAKNYWEYRAKVSVDGTVRTMEVYNCRDRLRIRRDGQVESFDSEHTDGAGEIVCRLFQSRSAASR